MTDLLSELEAVGDAFCDPERTDAEFKQAAADFITAHHAEIAAAVRDAERYRWLRTSADVSWNGWVTYQNLAAYEFERAEMDAAIDAAMSQEGEG